MQQLSVLELNGYLRAVLESDPILADVWVAGEVSNCKRHTSGHWYLTLKEGDERIDAVCFKSKALRLTLLPRDGMQILAHGQVSLYNGRVQLYIDAMYLAGEGLLQAQFERLRSQLEAEGLFERSRPLPPFPRRIGVVTSPTGAALQDMLHVLERRYPLAEVIVSPSLVQGEDAPDALVEALYALYDLDLDVVILARGGGSIEDLWAFNEERVARAVYAAPVPIITGVGHETDTTIVDYVADLRAPTPSAAAELAAPALFQLQDQLTAARSTLTNLMWGHLQNQQDSLKYQQMRLERAAPLTRLAVQRQQLDRLLERGERVIQAHVRLQKARLEASRRSLTALDPTATIRRGYAVVLDASGYPITDPAQVMTGDLLDVRVRGGQFTVEVHDES